MEYTLENLEKAVTLFYRTEAGQQAEAHQWLTEAQNSPQAWSFVWELLHPSRVSEVQFFAATTLHTKLLKYWNEVPVDHYEILKKRILESIINYAMGPKIVLNRLCITLSAYIIHTVPNHWPKAFEELVSSFQPQHLPNVEPERVIWILLEILTVIPEEFQSTILATSQRIRVRGVLQEVSKDILKVVEMCLMPVPSSGFEMSNLTTYLNSARCASAWIQLGGVNIDDCSRIMNFLIDLTCYVYWNREDPEGLSSEELELTEVTLEGLTAVVQHPNTHKYRNYIMKHSSNILEKFTKILQTERTSCDPNKDIVANIYLLVVTTADTHAKLFIENLLSNNEEERKITFNIFNCILECANLPGFYPIDETSSSITFGFWYTLQDEILGLDTAECAELLLIVKPYYRELVCVMLLKSMFPVNDDKSTWSLDDKELFRCYRQDIADTFMYCYNVLNIEMLDILNVKLCEALQKCAVSTDNWSLVESCLHAFSAVAECIEWENLYLPKLMETLNDIPYEKLHHKVLSSALETVGAYSEWIMDRPDMLEKVVPLVVGAVANTEVSSSATMALKDLTHNCQKFISPYADVILSSCQAALQSGMLKLPERIRLMYSLGKVLGVLPVPNIMEYLNVTLSPSFEEIQSLINAEPDATIATSLITRLKILTALFGSMYVEINPEDGVQQPLLVIVQNTMPLYTAIGNKYCRIDEVIDVLCALLKNIVTILMDECKPIVKDILELLVSIYQEVPQPSVLTLLKSILIMFGKEEQYSSIMQVLVREIVNTTLAMYVQLNSCNQLSEKSDVTEAFFSMLAQVYKKVPLLISTSGLDMGALFQCAIVCLAMPEMNTIKASTYFIVNFISQSRETAQASVVQNYGESLVMRVLLNLGGSAPRSSVDILSDILLILNKKYCDNLARWLHALLQQDGFPSSRISSQQKEYFIKYVLREKANKRKLSESVMEFALICRGILNTETLS